MSGLFVYMTASFKPDERRSKMLFFDSNHVFFVSPHTFSNTVKSCVFHCNAYANMLGTWGSGSDNNAIPDGFG